MKQELEIQVDNSYKNIIKLALPISVAIFIPQINNLTNTLFLGYYRPSQVGLEMKDLLAASGIAGIYYLTLVMIGYGLSTGLLMFMSRFAGENAKVTLGKYFSHGMFLALVSSIFLMGVSFLVAPALFKVAIHDAAIRNAAMEFIFIRTWGLPFIMLAQMCNSFFLSVSKSKYIIPGSFLQTVVNILLDYLLIFGLGFIPELGLNGTAYASVAAELIYMLTSLYLLFGRHEFNEFRIQLFEKPDTGILQNILLKSSPLVMQHFLSIGAWELFFIYVEHLGQSESAISQVLRSVFGLVGVFTWAFASTCNSMVSNLIGQGLITTVIPMIRKIATISFGLSLLLGLPMMFFPSQFLSLLVNDANLVEVGTSSLRIVVLASWTLSISTIAFNGVLGTGNTKLNMIFEFVAISLYAIYIHTVVEIARMPLVFAWSSEFVYWITLLSLSVWYLHSGRWKNNLKLERS